MIFLNSIPADVFSRQPAPVYDGFTFRAPKDSKCLLQLALEHIPQNDYIDIEATSKEALKQDLAPYMYARKPDIAQDALEFSLTGYYVCSVSFSMITNTIKIKATLSSFGAKLIGQQTWKVYIPKRFDNFGMGLLDEDSLYELRNTLNEELFSVNAKFFEKVAKKTASLAPSIVYEATLSRHAVKTITLSTMRVRKFPSGYVDVVEVGKTKAGIDPSNMPILLSALTTDYLYKNAEGIPDALKGQYIYDEKGDREETIKLLKQHLALKEI